MSIRMSDDAKRKQIVVHRIGWSQNTKDRLVRSAYNGYLREVRGRVHASVGGQTPTENLRVALAMTRQLENHLTEQLKKDVYFYKSNPDGYDNMVSCKAHLQKAAIGLRRALAMGLESSDVTWRPGTEDVKTILYGLPTLSRMERLAVDLGYIPCLSAWVNG